MENNSNIIYVMNVIYGSSLTQIFYTHQEIHRKAKSDDKQLITFDNGRHHLLLESPDIRKQVITETAEWIAQRLI